MPVYITDPDALERLRRVEGENWYTLERGAQYFREKLEAFRRFQAMLAEEGVDDWGTTPPILLTEDLTQEIDNVLYGAAGYARYIINGEGQLVLDGSSTREEKVQLALAEGFRVPGRALGNPSRRTRRVFRRAKRVITGPTGVAILAIGAASALGLIFWAARRSGAISFSPRPHPGPGRTAVIGDSIVAHPTGFVQYLDQNVHRDRTFQNFGVVGQGTQAILNDLRTQVIGHGFDEVIIEGGANDLGRSNAAEYITSRLRTMVQEAKAAGLKVVLLPMIPMARAAEQIPPINAITMSQGRSWGADVVVDTYSPLDDGRGGIRSGYVSPDGIHPTIAGQRVIGGVILARAYS